MLDLMSRGLGTLQRDLIVELQRYPWSGLTEIVARWTDAHDRIAQGRDYENLRRAMWGLYHRGLVEYRWVEDDGYQLRQWRVKVLGSTGPR
jgi:hypothetical protein